MKCDYMLPIADPGIVAHDDPLPSCLLKEGHEGDHLVLSSYGGYVVFMPYTEPCGDDCECAEDTGTINYECYTWEKISRKEALRMLNPPEAKKSKRSP